MNCNHSFIQDSFSDRNNLRRYVDPRRGNSEGRYPTISGETVPRKWKPHPVNRRRVGGLGSEVGEVWDFLKASYIGRVSRNFKVRDSGR